MSGAMKRTAYLTVAGVRKVLLRAGFEESVNAGDEGFRVHNYTHGAGVVVIYVPHPALSGVSAQVVEYRRLDDYARTLKGLGFSAAADMTPHGYGLTVGGSQ